MRWHLFIEEYNPIFHYVKGDNNTLTDALSRLPQKEEKGVRAVDPHSLAQLTPTSKQGHANIVDDNRLDNNDVFSFTTTIDEEVLECFLNFPDVDHEHPFALDYSSIANAQKNDPLLMSKLRTNHMQYGEAEIGNKQTMIVFHR